MKNILFFLFLMLTAGLSYAQENNTKKEDNPKEVKKKVIIIKDSDDQDTIIMDIDQMKEVEMNIENDVHDFPHFNRELEMESKHSNKAILGVFVDDAPGMNGASITNIIEGTGAEKAGLKEGDIILSIGDKKVNGRDALIEKLSSYSPGDKVKVKYLHEGEIESKSIELSKPSNKNVNREIIKRYKCVPNEHCEKMMKEMKKEMKVMKKKIKSDQSSVTDDDESVIAIVDGNANLSVNYLAGQPNPNQGQMTISFQGDKKPFTIEVVDLDGRELFKDKVTDNSGQYTKEVILNKTSGTAVIKVTQGDKVTKAKVIINN